MAKPTQAELDTCLEVLDYIVASWQEHEPQAQNDIAEVEEVIRLMPREASDIQETTDTN